MIPSSWRCRNDCNWYRLSTTHFRENESDSLESDWLESDSLELDPLEPLDWLESLDAELDPLDE